MEKHIPEPSISLHFSSHGRDLATIKDLEEEEEEEEDFSHLMGEIWPQSRTLKKEGGRRGNALTSDFNGNEREHACTQSFSLA